MEQAWAVLHIGAYGYFESHYNNRALEPFMQNISVAGGQLRYNLDKQFY